MNKQLTALLAAVWIVKGFAAIDDLVSFLNVLPPEEAVGAKTMTLGPNRALLGVATAPYYLIFKTEHADQYKEENKPRSQKNVGDY